MASKSKVCDSFEEAVADIVDGAVVMVSGFGPPGTPVNLVTALRDQGARELTLITSGTGMGGEWPDVGMLFEARQAKKVIAAFAFPQVHRPEIDRLTPFHRAYVAGQVDLELAPLGTLAERIRAGGAGIGGFYTRTGVGTVVEQGKEKRVIEGKGYLLERPLRADFALISAHKADRLGNLTYLGTSRFLNPVMATAADITIAEVDEIVDPGELNPETIITPFVYVDRIVQRRAGE
jgi:3-oxoacid CoA-transferase A subunit